jgi:hypothetical protein
MESIIYKNKKIKEFHCLNSLKFFKREKKKVIYLIKCNLNSKNEKVIIYIMECL